MVKEALELAEANRQQELAEAAREQGKHFAEDSQMF